MLEFVSRDSSYSTDAEQLPGHNAIKSEIISEKINRGAGDVLQQASGVPWAARPVDTGGGPASSSLLMHLQELGNQQRMSHKPGFLSPTQETQVKVWAHSSLAL